MTNSLDKNCREKSKHTFYIQYFFIFNHAIYEIVWKYMVYPERPQMTI